MMSPRGTADEKQKILDLLWGGQRTAWQIAKLTGIDPETVASLLGQMLELNEIEKEHKPGSRSGGHIVYRCVIS